MTTFFAKVEDQIQPSPQKSTEESKGIAGQISKDIEFGRGGSCPDIEIKGAVGSQIGGDHYKRLTPSPFEVVRSWGLLHAEAEIIYHVIRHRSRHGRRDLEKAIHWTQLIIESEYSDAKDCEPCPPQPPPVSSSSGH